MVVLSCAVTMIVMVLLPTFSVTADETPPLVLAVPLTVIVALAWLTVGVKVNDVVVFPTFTE